MNAKSDDIYIFGANDTALCFIQELCSHGIEIKAVLDNAVNKQGQEIEKIKICSLESIEDAQRVKIIIACRNFPSIVEQLVEFGIDMDKIFLSTEEVINANDKLLFCDSESNVLLISNGGYDPFIHSRVKKYNEKGLLVDVVSFFEDKKEIDDYYLDDIHIIEIGKADLLLLLRNKHYSEILIHFMNYRIASLFVIAKSTDIPMIIWSHGYESLPWYRTWFQYSVEELERKKAYFLENDIEKRKFLRRWFNKENVKWIFVSNWHCHRVKNWVGFLPSEYYIIHNFIDEDYYNIPFPDTNKIWNILSIKSHMSNVYANDVVAKAIIELSHRNVFKKLCITLYGFGELFDDNFKDLIALNFSNVKIIKKKLTSEEMKFIVRDNGIFLSPTRYDSHGVTVAEMMAAGRAVITSSIPVMLELYDESSVSFCEGDNPYSLADEIEYLINNQDEFISKCQNAREIIKKQCGYAATVEKELMLIRETVM